MYKLCKANIDLCVLWMLTKVYVISSKPPMDLLSVIKNGNNSPHLGPLLSKCVTTMSTAIVIFQAWCPYFKVDMLVIPAQITAQLLPVHTEHLAKCMSWIMDSCFSCFGLLGFLFLFIYLFSVYDVLLLFSLSSLLLPAGFFWRVSWWLCNNLCSRLVYR